MTIDGRNDVEFLRHVIEGGRGAELENLRRFRPGSQEALDERLGRAEVSRPDDLGLAVDALALAQIVVFVAGDRLSGQAGHSVPPLSDMLRSYQKIVRPTM